MIAFQCGTGENCRSSWCISLHDVKVHSSSCFKVAVLVLLGPFVVLCTLLLQEGTLHTSSLIDPWKMFLGSAINPPRESSSSSPLLSTTSHPTSKACLSRMQHMLHRPPSQYIPPAPGFASALSAYEKHHAECFLGRNWTETFLNSNADSGQHQNDSCKFLVYVEGGAGLGNRLLALMSAFLYALLTNRVFLLDSNSSRGHIANLLCEPFHNSSWSLPQGFPFEMLDRSPSLGQAIEHNFNMSVMRLNLDHAQSWGDQRFFCAETRERMNSVTWISWRSNQYFVPRFFTFPDFWPRLTAFFPNASLAFTHMSRHLLLPTNFLWEKIFRIHSSYLSSAERLVGIQIRRHSVDNSGDYSPVAFNHIVHCLVEHQILPNTSGAATDFPSEPLLEKMELRSTGFRTKLKDRESNGVTSVLVASLQHKYAEELQDLYTNSPTVDGVLVRVHMVSHEGMEWHSYDQAQKAFVEMWLLSLSDSIATSNWSTFGYVAQGLAALRPYIVNVRGDLANSKLHCSAGQSVEPCNHFPFWPKEDCGNESTLTPSHKQWIEGHIEHCQDEYWGLQLVE